MIDTDYAPRFISNLTKSTLALILAGGRGSRMQDLTLWRAKPATPFGGKYRIIDFPLSNCVNSDIRRVGVMSQYKSHSLIRHIQKGWGHLRGEFGEFIELLPAQQRVENSWYSGTADAVYQNIDIIRSHNPRLVLILAGDHIYKMDYGPMLAFHVESQADMTIGSIDVPVKDAVNFGVIACDSDNRIIAFTEKPDCPAQISGQTGLSLASMGIYVFDTEFLINQLIADADNIDSEHDFGRNIIPSAIDDYRVFSYRFRNGSEDTRAYWRDVGTVDSYWSANMELMGVTPELNLYDQEWPVWTYQEQTPPAKFVFNEAQRKGVAIDSLVADGCIVSGSRVEHSLLFNNVYTSSYSEIIDSVVLPSVQIGERCKIRRAIIDKGAIIPPDTIIGEDLELDKQRYYVTEQGVRLVTPEMLGQRLHYSR